MANFLSRLLRGGQTSEPDDPSATRPRLAFDADPAAIYAIGDIHGRFDLLEAMEGQIFADAAAIEGDKWIITLGDHVDRGLHSSEVVDHLLLAPPDGWQRFCLCGNHELEMLNFLARPSSGAGWLGLGGIETLLSYGVPATEIYDRSLRRDRWRQLIERWVPSGHVAWLTGLPVMLQTPHYLFVHAGLVPDRPLPAQHDLDLVGYRDDFVEDFSGFGKTVVHGHQVRRTPLVTASRIALDTGAYATGVLTAVRLIPGRQPLLLTAKKP